MGPAPVTNPKKHRKVLWITLGVVVLIIVIAAAAGGSKNKNTNASATTTTTAASGSATTATTATTSKAGGHGLNQVVKDGSFAFTVTGVQCGVTSVGDPATIGKTAPAGTQWCVYTMTVTNDKSASGDYFAGNQKALDASGKQLSADTTALIYMDNSSASETSTINPGVSIDVQIPFQLATGDTIKTLVLHDSAFSGGVKVNVG
jgi:hypothetical protein